MRLGYACLNLTLKTRMRTCRLANATPPRVEALARENLESVREMAQWNAAHGIRFLRLSSDLVPFAGHPATGDGWREALADDFAETGRVLAEHDQRVSAHPGQFTILNSPRPEVVESSMNDLEAQATFFDLMGRPADLVIHLGGAYGDKEAALARFTDVAAQLPDTVREKLVIENDDVTWHTGDALRAHAATGFPVVFDTLHDAVKPTPDLPAREAFARALATWPEHRHPKMHYSDQDLDKRPGAHARRVDVAGFLAWHAGVRDLPGFDVMIEAKDKELAVLPIVAALREREAASAGTTVGTH